MDKKVVIDRIEAIGVIPVIRAASADEAARVIDAIAEGGIDVFEITMTVPDAEKLIEEIAKKFGTQKSSQFINGILDGILKRYNLAGADERATRN